MCTLITEGRVLLALLEDLNAILTYHIDLILSQDINCLLLGSFLLSCDHTRIQW